MGDIVVHDISVTLGIEAAAYPGDVTFERTVQSALAEGAPYELSSLTLSAHAGTHIDAPSHVVAGGRALDDYPAGAFLLPALVSRGICRTLGFGRARRCSSARTTRSPGAHAIRCTRSGTPISRRRPRPCAWPTGRPWWGSTISP